MDERLVTAAQSGDQRALDDLVAQCLPLVYNIVGRALSGHADVDDVVQETMLRVVHGLDGLRDPGSFRSWLVAITVRRIRDRGQARQAALARGASLDEAADVADPGADFVDLTVVRLGLSGQRREVAEATRWLDDGDRQLLALWWLEAAGELTRAEVAAAMGLSLPHAAVRIQRMKAQLEAARAVVVALRTTPRCPELSVLVYSWDGRPSGLWRKRLARHTRDCPTCTMSWVNLVPAEGLLVGTALVPLPLGFALPALTGTATAAATGLISKPVAALAALAALVAGGSAAYTVWHEPAPSGREAFAAAPPRIVPQPEESAPPPATAPARSPVRTAPGYGSTVDRAELAPPPLTPPGPLPKRPAGEVAVVGLVGDHVMEHRDDSVAIRGRGYFVVRYQIAFASRAGGMAMPTWTGLSGKLFHVASGGLRRMDDPKPGGPATNTWMGSPDTGYTVLPPGAQQMWQNEFFYLDGEVVLTNRERGADYSVIVFARTFDEVNADINTPPPADPVAAGWVRYGVVRDTGDDGAPVPQYLTRATPTDPAQVPQQSRVTP